MKAESSDSQVLWWDKCLRMKSRHRLTWMYHKLGQRLLYTKSLLRVKTEHCFLVKTNLTCHLNLYLAPLTNPLRQVLTSMMSMRRRSISEMSSVNCLMKVMEKVTTLIKMRRRVIKKRLSSRKTMATRNRPSKAETILMSSNLTALWSSISIATAFRTLLPRRGDKIFWVCHLQTQIAERETVAPICRLFKTQKQAIPWW